MLTLNAINFGSGWFPVLRKRAGTSGYLTVATRLRERFERAGAVERAASSRGSTRTRARALLRAGGQRRRRAS